MSWTGLNKMVFQQAYHQSFRPKRIGNFTWYLTVQPLGNALIEILRNPDVHLEKETLLLGTGSTSRVVMVSDYVIKRIDLPVLKTKFRYMFKPLRAERAAKNALHLETHGVKTAIPVGFTSKKRFGLPESSYLVTRYIPNSLPLNEILADNTSLANTVVSKIARLIARTHDSGLWHRDLNVTNLIFDKNLVPYLIDLGGALICRELTEKQAASDLGRLSRLVHDYPIVKRIDCELFIREYCRCRGLNRVPRPNTIRNKLRRWE